MSDAATLTRLQPHMLVPFERRVWRVARVNDCRAWLLPVAKTRRTLKPATGPHAGQTVTVESEGEGVGISPNSELDIIGRWDPATQAPVYFAPPMDADERRLEPAKPAAASAPSPSPCLAEPNGERVGVRCESVFQPELL